MLPHQAAGLKLILKKCYFAVKEVEVLEHLVSIAGVKADPARIEKVLNGRVPRKKKELRSFLMSCYFHIRFVKGFEDAAAPLHALTGDGAAFLWGPHTREAFNKLKGRMSEPQILAFPDATKAFFIFVDASPLAVGAVLIQKKETGRYHLVQYASRSLSKEERRYRTFGWRQSR